MDKWIKSKIQEPSLIIFFVRDDFDGNVAKTESEKLFLSKKYSEERNLFILSNRVAGS